MELYFSCIAHIILCISYHIIYYYLVRRLKRSRDLQIRGALGRALLTQSNRDYWREISKVRGKGRSNSSVVNGYSDSKDISNEFANNYNILYNSVSSDLTDLQSMAHAIREDITIASESTDQIFPHVITVPDYKQGNQEVLALLHLIVLFMVLIHCITL